MKTQDGCHSDGTIINEWKEKQNSWGKRVLSNKKKLQSEWGSICWLLFLGFFIASTSGGSKCGAQRVKKKMHIGGMFSIICWFLNLFYNINCTTIAVSTSTMKPNMSYISCTNIWAILKPTVG